MTSCDHPDKLRAKWALNDLPIFGDLDEDFARTLPDSGSGVLMSESPTPERLPLPRSSSSVERAGAPSPLDDGSASRSALSTSEAAALSNFRAALEAGDTASGAAIRIALLIRILETGRPAAMADSYRRLLSAEEGLLRRFSEHEQKEED